MRGSSGCMIKILLICLLFAINGLYCPTKQQQINQLYTFCCGCVVLCCAVLCCVVSFCALLCCVAICCDV